MKASERSVLDYLNDIREAAENATRFTADISFDVFRGDTLRVYAVVHALELVGEAAKHIPAAKRRRYPAIPWKSAAGTRDKLIHGYFGIDLELVWNTVKNDLPSLLELVKEAITAETIS